MFGSTEARDTPLRRAGACIAILALALGITGCASTTSDGDDIAERQARQVADEIGAAMTPPVIRSREADWLVTEVVALRDDRANGISVQPLSWSGDSGTGDRAQIDVRITVDVEELFGGFAAPSNTAGTATACYRFGVIGYRFYDTLSVTDIPCTDDPAPPLPVPDPLPSLPADASATLAAILTSTTSATLFDDVKTAFPQDFVTVDVADARGALIAAVGVPAERQCLIAVRGLDGTVAEVGYDPIWIEPGEMGCVARLYTNPPQ